MKKNAQYIKKTVEKNWRRFEELRNDPNFQSRFAELQNKFRLPIPSDFPFPISNIDDIERVFREAYYKSFPLYLLAQITLYLQIQNSEEKYYPDTVMDRLLVAYYEIKKSLKVHPEPSPLELDPFHRRLIEAVDLSNPYSALILPLIIKHVIAPKWQNRYRSWFLLRAKELMDQGITESHAEAVFILDILWWFVYKAFWKDLRTFLKDFPLGSEWLGPIFMYAVTGKMLYVPPVNTEFGVPLVIPLKYHELVKAYVELIRINQKIGVNLADYFLTPSYKKKQITPLLPSDIKHWEAVTIKFLDGHNINIKAKDLNIKVNYKEMGFENERTLKPNKQWELFQDLADGYGELTRDYIPPKEFQKLKKRKEKLSKRLRYRLGIKEDPFLPYKQQKTYKIRINLIPESD